MGEKPTLVSLIIPTYNRNNQLKECLQSVTKMKFPKEELEVIIVNDGGNEFDDDLNKLINEHGYKTYSQENNGPAAARNYGAAHAAGNYLAFIDDDCIPAADWLSIMVGKAEKSPEDLIGGKVVNALKENIYAEASQMIIDYLYTAWETKRTVRSFFTTNNMIMSRMGFEKMNGFDKDFTSAAAEDREFCTRWQVAGKKMNFDPNAIVYHLHKLHFKSFLTQQFNYGKGLFLYDKKCKQITKQKRRLESLSFYFKLLMYPFKMKPIFKAMKLFILMVISQAALFSGYLSLHFSKARSKNV
jgi:GT2 family glycosyltransferase